MKKIGYVCSSNPFYDRKSWSGSIYKIREAIEMAGFEVIWIPYDPSYKKDSWKNKLNNYYWKIRRRILKKNILGGIHSRFNAKRYSQSIDLNVIRECNYLFFPGGAQMSLFFLKSATIIQYTIKGRFMSR